MEAEPSNNRQALKDTDSDLHLAFCLNTPSFPPVDIDAVLKDAEGPLILEDSVAVRRSSCDPCSVAFASRRTIIMLSSVSALGFCAASFVALVFSLGSGNPVMAQVQIAIKKVRTASYTVTQTAGNQPSRTWKVMLRGENLCRVDQPSGNYMVFDVRGKKTMEVDRGKSKVQITEDLPVPRDFNILAMLANPRKSSTKAQPGVPNREIGGVTAIGFIIEENGAAYYVWIDPKTHLPLEMEAERRVALPDGEGGVTDMLVKERWSNFSFNEYLDERLFTFQPPHGFAVDTKQARSSNAAKKRNRALQNLDRQRASQQKAADKKSSAVTQSNYDKIQTGMSLVEVEAILGKGNQQASSGESFGGIMMNAKGVVWQDGSKIITVMFMNNEVQSKSQMGF